MRIDNSQLSTFQDCPRKYYNRHKLCLKKQTEDERDIDMSWGKAHHKALELYYKGKTREECYDAFNKSYIPLDGDKVKTNAHGIVLLTAYFNYYEGNTNELGDKNMTTLGVEIKDSFKINDDLEWIVKIDRVVKNNAGIWCVDHKVTGKSLYTFFNKFTPNQQVSGYVDYVIRKYGQCSGFIPNVLYYGHRERKYKGEEPGFHYQFQRDIVNRNKEQIDDFEQNVIQWTNKLKQCENDNYWGKNENQCGRCGFRELCTNVDDENVRETLYEKYNPLQYLDE